MFSKPGFRKFSIQMLDQVDNFSICIHHWLCYVIFNLVLQMVSKGSFNFCRYLRLDCYHRQCPLCSQATRTGIFQG